VSKCKRCGEPAEPKDLLEGFCAACIFAMAEERHPITKADVARIKAGVELETAGLFPPETLLWLLDDMVSRIEDGDDRALAVQHTANEIMRLGGLGECRDVGKIADSYEKMAGLMQEAATEMWEEIRRKVRILSSLGGKA
jgi:hypothetical protein